MTLKRNRLQRFGTVDVTVRGKRAKKSGAITARRVSGEGPLNLAYWVLYQARVVRAQPRRYVDLLRAAYACRPRTIVEIGTYNGIHARHLIQIARIFHPASEVHYWGFDLFEMMTPEVQQAEFSLRPPSVGEVEKFLRRTGANVHLRKGFSKETVPQAAPLMGRADLVFVDGGHALETVRTDWQNVQPLLHPGTVVVFDDWFENAEREVQGFGCREVIRKLDPARYRVELLPHVDEFEHPWGILRTRMVKVTLRA